MNANQKSIGALFSLNVQYLIPIFQRPYVWDEGQWQPFWEDIVELVERLMKKPESKDRHFLGAIVLNQVRNNTGAAQLRELIDGQQRLMTLQIFLSVLRDVAESYNFGGFSNEFGELLENNAYRGNEEEARYKVLPTNADRTPFKWVIDTTSPNELLTTFDESRRKKWTGKQIPDCYLWLFYQLDELSESFSEAERLEYFQAFSTAIHHGLEVVAIDLNPEDDSQLIFETLNARGTPLLPSDLIKNRIFQLAERNGEDVVALFEEYWAPFEQQANFWRQRIKRGRETHPRIEHFLQYILRLVTYEPVKQDELFETYRNLDRYDTWLNTASAESQLEVIREYAQIFGSFDARNRSSEIGQFFHCIKKGLDNTTVYPLLLLAFDRLEDTGDSSELREFLRHLESFLIRRRICNLTRKNYNRFFLKVARILTEKGITAENLREELQTGEGVAVRWPDDDEFESAWRSLPLYKSLKRSTLRYVLRRINQHIREDRVESDGSEDVFIKSKLTIEHIMPVEWSKHWQLPTESHEAIERRDNLVHNVGNLTLLTQKLNSRQSNAPWDVKRKNLREASALHINLDIVNDERWQERWDEDTMLERNRELFEVARNIW